MTKRIIYSCLLLSAIACTSENETTTKPADVDYVKEQARIAAEEVLKFPANTMERENAIIAIRVKEYEIRKAGFEACADSFAVEAARILGY